MQGLCWPCDGAEAGLDTELQALMLCSVPVHLVMCVQSFSRQMKQSYGERVELVENPNAAHMILNNLLLVPLPSLSSWQSTRLVIVVFY